MILVITSSTAAEAEFKKRLHEYCIAYYVSTGLD
jgi:hypothetical protein